MWSQGKTAFNKMNIQKIYEDQSSYSPEFQSFLTELKPHIDTYAGAKQEAQKQRMIIIGKCEDYRQQFPQRSSDHRALRTAMNNEGWSNDVIKNSVSAYRTYKELEGNINPEFKALAEQSNPTQLLVIGRGENTTLAYDAAMALKRDGNVPSAAKLRGHLGGYTDNKFESRTVPGRNSEQPEQRSQSSSQPAAPAPTPVLTEEERKRRSEMSRMNVDESGYKHLEYLVSLKTLPHIKDVQTASLWNGGSDEHIDRCLNVLEQKLSQQSKSGSQVELRLREMLARYTKRAQATTVDVTELSDDGDDLSIPQSMLSLEGKRRRAMRLRGR